MNALLCLLADEVEESVFRDYVGQALWHITTIQHLKTDQPNEMPQYVEIMHPNIKVKEQTAEEIKNEILKKLGWDNGNARNA